MATSKIHHRLSLVLQTILFIQIVIALLQRHWVTALFATGILFLTLAPFVLANKLRVRVPPQFQLMTIAIVFAALFLGEMRNYFERFWWWDLALHAVTGFLMGIVGFLLVYVFHGKGGEDLRQKSAFVAFFAFTFALSAGTVWEIAEYLLDQLLDLNLQKPMLGDPSGLTDTMIDLMIDALGAAVVCIYGYFHLKNPATESFLERWICFFIAKNPRFFKRRSRA